MEGCRPSRRQWLNRRMDLTSAQYGLGLLSGGLVGFVLALVGGGGSLLATPLLLYVVGIPQPHLAIGTSALAVAASAAVSVVPHWRSGVIKWRCTWTFTVFGVGGAVVGSTIGKAMPGDALVAWFGLLMVAVGFIVLIRRNSPGLPEVKLDRDSARRLVPRLAATGVAVGVVSGVFGIGGGFLIVPALLLATGMPLINAIGSSLIAVAALGSATAANYAIAGFVDWGLAAILLTGGIAGGALGASTARRLAGTKNVLNVVFSLAVVAAGATIFATRI
jgi:uncharacterized membrane protein YfcA